MPDILNWFGWCTWDAFYTNVTSENVKQGLQRWVLLSKDNDHSIIYMHQRDINLSVKIIFCSFEKGGIPAKFVIIDDGWQSVDMDPNGTEWKSDHAAK